MAEVELGRDDEGTHLHYYYCKIKDWIQREIMFMFTYWSDRCTRWMSAPFWLILSPSSLFFLAVLLWYAIFSLFLTMGHASLACHLSSLSHCGSCFFGMPSFLSFFRWREIISLRYFLGAFKTNTCAQELMPWLTFPFEFGSSTLPLGINEFPTRVSPCIYNQYL